jgi:hypothetical protein
MDRGLNMKTYEGRQLSSNDWAHRWRKCRVLPELSSNMYGLEQDEMLNKRDRV